MSTISMGPPLLSSYSLRVQLFAPESHSSGDKPIRCFRVVTYPEVTVRQFCQEASRIHEINYGEPLAIKKVQDEEGFDITQSEILGTLFATTSIIRVIQAFANQSARDSVPPSSALRFEPTTSRRRTREESSRPEDNGRTSPFKTNKRQRVSSPNPDEPLPSREVASEVAGPSDAGRRPSGQQVIPDSQTRGKFVSGMQKVLNTRQVRQDLPMIPETPSPSPPPEDHVLPSNGQPLADGLFSKLNDNPDHEDSSFLSNVDNSSPLREASIRAQSHPSNSRAKSTSYHIPRTNERGTSVSTAATSPLSLDQRNHVENGPSSTKRKRPSPTLPKHNNTPFRSHNEDSIYETIVSEDEGTAMLKRNTDAFRFKKSPRAILPGARNVNTPPTGLRRTSAGRESTNSPAELPLTPGSDKRRKQEQKEAEEAVKTRAAAAEAAEQRKREADEARQAEVLRVAAEERREREEQERLDVEEFNRAQAEITQKLMEKAAQAEAERKQRAEQEAEEAKRREQERIAREEALERHRREELRLAREKSEQERREQLTEKARIAAEKKNEENRLAKEKAAAEAKRLREEKEREKIDREERDAAAADIEEEISGSQKSTRSVASEGSRHSSPALPRLTPIPPPRPQASSTSFIPSGKKSNLKRTFSSQALTSSSPSVPRSISRDTSHSSATREQQMKERKVSFNEETFTPHSETRILPPGKKIISSNTAITPKSAAPNHTSSQATNKAAGSPAITPKTAVRSDIPPEANRQTPILPPASRRSSTPAAAPKAVARTSEEKGLTPIPVPGKAPSASRTSQERDATPAQTKILPPKGASQTTTPKILVSKHLQTYGRAARKKGNIVIAAPPQENASDEESDGDAPNKASAILPTSSTSAREIRSSNTTIKLEPPGSRDNSEDSEEAEEHEKMDEDETESHNSSPEPSRDSRSPVTFNQSPKEPATSKSRSRSPVSASSTDEEEAESEHSSSDDEATPKPAQQLAKAGVPLDEDADSDSDQESDLDKMDEDAPPMGAENVAKINTAHDERDESPSEAASKSDVDEDSDQNIESDEEEEPQVQVPKSSQELPPHRDFNKSIMSKVAVKPTQSNSKGSSSVMNKSTQDEVDRQLTSSIREARSVRSSSISNPIPASSVAIKPKVGASLASLLASKSNLIQSSAARSNGIAASSQKLRLAQQEEEEEESDEESEDDDDDDELSEEEIEVPKGKNPAIKTRKLIPKEGSQKNSDDSDSDSESGVDEERARQELFSQINAVANQKDEGSIGSFPSPREYRSSTQVAGNAKKFEKKKSDKYLTGYLFSQPA